MTKKTVHSDIVIVGGGIAGLWTLVRLTRLGYQAILLETDSLGAVQTGASQGIIHGGTKYALTGKLTGSSQAIREMPGRWKACLQGTGEIDLRQVKSLSPHQYLWSSQRLASKITGFFASKVMQSKMEKLPPDRFIAPFDNPDFRGELYQLDEPVLDVASLIQQLHRHCAEQIYRFDVEAISKTGAVFELSSGENIISSRNVILTAGEGNEALLRSLQFRQPQMQRRALHMPMLKAEINVLPFVYGHCLGSGALPRMTITSHQLGKEVVWYLGGEIAEQGIQRTVSEQIVAAKSALNRVLPWMDFSRCQWSSLRIDRAEPKMTDGSRPVEPAVYEQQGLITAWPVKLAMTPLMVDKIISQLEASYNKPAGYHFLPTLPHEQAECSLLPWQKITCWQ